MSSTPAVVSAARPPRSSAGASANAAQIRGNGSGSGNGTTTNTPTPTPTPTPGKMTAYTPSARRSARSAALSEAAAVLQSPGLTQSPDERDYLNSFNLLSVVSNPRAGAGLWGDVHAATTASSGHGAAAGTTCSSSHGAAGDASNPTASSTADGTPFATATTTTGGTPATTTPTANPNAAATSALSAATGLSLATLAPLTDVEETIAEGLHDLSTTINTHHPPTPSGIHGRRSLWPPVGGGGGGEYYLEYEGLDELGEGRMTAQLAPEELREELRGVDLATVEAYLRRCGGLAWRFDSRRGESELINVGDGGGGSGGGGGGNGTSGGGGGDSAKNLAGEMDMERAAEDGNDAEEEEEKKDQKEDGNAAAVGSDDDPTNDVPDIFFSPYFDLTDPHTFESLLVMDEDGDGGDDAAGTASTAATNDEETAPSLMTIHPTESLSSHLDAIELALLNQVRSKSSSFFRETNRFSYLQHQVAECVTEVQSLRTSLGNIRERTVTDVELIPIMDRKRQELRLLGAVLDEVQDVVEVKGSVAGLIAAGDYVGAVAAIRNARSLLRGDKKKKKKKKKKNAKDKKDNAKESGEDEKTMEEDDENDDDGDDANMTPTERAEKEAAEAALNFPLSRLAAMSKVDDQLNQYEELVVNDLANELVETFLSWEDGTSSSSNTASLLSSPFSLSGGVGRRSRTREIVHALSLCQKLGHAADLYKTKLSDVVRVTVRTTVTECAADALAELERMKNSKKISATATEGGDKPSQGKSSVTAGVTSMTFDQFLSCLDMLFEQILSLLKGAVGVSKFLREEGIVLKDEDPVVGEANGAAKKGANGGGKTTTTALTAAADLSHKSISELLRLRKESHSLITFDEMKRLWDTCLSFTLSIEKFSGQKAYGLRSTLLTQAKAFVERRHEANMASLVSALDGERWNQCDVSSERQAALERLCSGRAVLSGQGTIDVATGAPSSTSATTARPEGAKLAEADVEGKRYKVVWSCLLLVEMIMSNVACAAHFQTLSTNVVGKVCELLRLFNSRTTQLVLGAGAIHSAARLKSINAKHLSLVTQCLGLVVTILPHVRAALMAQLPAKQHSLLLELDKIKKEYGEHNEKVLAKLVSIIGGIIERGLAPRIAKIDFDARAKSMPTPSIEEVNDANYENSVTCCQFLDGISVNARKMHQVLVALLPPEDLIDVFSRIFAYVDTKVPALFLAAVAEGEKQTVAAAKAAADAASQRAQQGGGTVVALPPQPGPAFHMPKTKEGKLRMILEVDSMSKTLNRLPNVQPWDFTAVRVLERELDVEFNLNSGPSDSAGDVSEAAEGHPSSQDDTVETEDDTKQTEAQQEPPEQDGEGLPDEGGTPVVEDGEEEVVEKEEPPTPVAKEDGEVGPTLDTVDATVDQGEGTDTAVEPSSLENGESSAAVEVDNNAGETATDNLPEMEATPATPDATTGVDRAEPPLPSAPNEVPTAENSTSMEQPPGEDDGDS